jgi:hypothetical protein
VLLLEAAVVGISSNSMQRTYDRAIAQAVSRWLPTAAARVRARVWLVGFVVDKMAPGQVFSEYYISFHQLLHPHNHPEQVQ